MQPLTFIVIKLHRSFAREGQVGNLISPGVGRM